MKKLIEDIFCQYRGTFKIIRDYWSVYGGIYSVLSSPYFHTSVIITMLSIGSWTKEGWWDLPISIIPSLVSFTLAGYAMLTALGDDGFREKMATTAPPQQSTVFMQISSTFAHFIVVQTASLVLALICKTRPLYEINHIFGGVITRNLHPITLYTFKYTFWLISYCLFIYACVLILSCTLSLFRSTRWLNEFLIQKSKNNT